jgi:hypothetical protein
MTGRPQVEHASCASTGFTALHALQYPLRVTSNVAPHCAHTVAAGGISLPHHGQNRGSATASLHGEGRFRAYTFTQNIRHAEAWRGCISSARWIARTRQRILPEPQP